MGGEQQVVKLEESCIAFVRGGKDDESSKYRTCSWWRAVCRGKKN